MKTLHALTAFLFLLLSCSKSASPGTPPAKNDTIPKVTTKFTIPVFPDTQETMVNRQQMFFSQTRWIAKVKDSLNIPLALHVGDLVNFDTVTHFQFADKVMGVLDSASVPYVIALGNHDTEAVLWNSGSAAPGNTNLNLRKTTKFNTYFPTTRFKLLQGIYEENKIDNGYHFFEAGGKKWIVINLEFCARPGAAKWADSVIGANPTRNAIVLTHYHLTPNGQIANSNAGYGDMKVDDIFNHHLKKHKNLIMVLSGHVCYNSSRTDVGTSGNTIYSILQNYQCQDGGGGYLRLLEIDTKAGTIVGKMYSPHYNSFLEQNSTVSFSNVQFVN